MDECLFFIPLIALCGTLRFFKCTGIFCEMLSSNLEYFHAHKTTSRGRIAFLFQMDIAHFIKLRNASSIFAGTLHTKVM